MKALRITGRISKGIALAVMAVVLLVFGCVTVIYSPWFQDSLREGLVRRMNMTDGTRFELAGLRLYVPLHVRLDGLLWIKDADTLVAAGEADVSVRPLPLLKGDIDVSHARLRRAIYTMGNRDSATMLVLHADTVRLGQSQVHLKPMGITVSDGSLLGATVDLYINPNPPSRGKNDANTATEPSEMGINVNDLQIRNLTYRMNMMPTIDSLGVKIGDAHLKGAKIDLGKQTVKVGSLIGSRLSAAYIAPDSAAVARCIVAPPDTTPSQPWTVTVGTVKFDRSDGLYTTRGHVPQRGLDFGYIAVSDLWLNVHDFYNRASSVILPLALRGTERCGVTLDANGTLDISEAALRFRDWAIATPQGTSLEADGLMGMGDLLADPDVALRLDADGQLSPADLALMFPAFSLYLDPLGKSPVDVYADISGTSGALDIAGLDIGAGGVAQLHAAGNLANVFIPDRMSGRIRLDGTIDDVRPWTEKLLAGTGLTVPAMTIDGDVSIDRGSYRGGLGAVTHGGDLALKGSFNGRGADYSADLEARQFPLSAFLPASGLGVLSGSISAHGHGFDPSAATTRADVAMDIEALDYHGTVYRDIDGSVSLQDGHGEIALNSGNPGLRFALDADADLSPQRYAVRARLDVQDIDLQRLKLSTTEASVSTLIDLDADLEPSLSKVDACLDLHSFAYRHPEGTMKVSDVTLRLDAIDSVTNASVRNRDLYAYFSSPNGLKALAAQGGNVGPVLTQLMAEHRISVTDLQRALPQFNLAVEAGPQNALTQILADSNMGFGHLSLAAHNDSLVGMQGRVTAFRTGTTRLDTITLNMRQHQGHLDYRLAVNNRPGTLDAWAKVDVFGTAGDNSLALNMRQENSRGECGYDIGARLSTAGDSTATFTFSNTDPRIAYHNWTINDDNFITYDFRRRHIDANLLMHGAGSSLELYTEHALSNDTTLHGHDEDLVINIGDVHLQDWLSLNPFAPRVKGDLTANLRLNAHSGQLTANGLVSLNDLIYGKERIGDLRTTLNVLTNRSGLINADVALWVNNAKAMTLRGALNDSTKTSPLDLDLEMIHFPLATANAFVPGIARLGGALNGSMQVSGTGGAPRLNGYVEFDSAQVAVVMAGTTLHLGGERIPVTDNVIAFDDFKIRAANDNPLTVSGDVRLTSLTDADIDLRLNGNNILLVNTNRARGGATVYGKAYAGIDASLKGNLRFLDINATLDVLPGTNITYVMTDAESVIREQSGNTMVKFVNFADTAAVAAADSLVPPEGLLINLTAVLNVMPGSTISVDLNPGGSDKLQLKSQGTLNYTQAPIGDGRLTGRLNLDGGFVRYTPPFMSEKKFDFSEGSYVAFNGDLLNPTLNIHAVDRIRANVTQTGQNSRLIYFDVDLGVTGTLANMDVAFDLSTDDDATVANELATMSPTQRASTAMNMLITNMYSSGDTKADANLSGNALYSFLTSQLNSWAANTIKGVDLSFGISQYDNTRAGATTQATSYSYRVSKSLFDDRFKIVVGGNYSTDADNDENLAQNLVNDISFEYLINRQGTMLVRIFRHTGYESILEGEITQTGVGFVYKRKINRIADMFMPFRRLRKKSKSADPAPADGTNAKATAK